MKIKFETKENCFFFVTKLELKLKTKHLFENIKKNYFIVKTTVKFINIPFTKKKLRKKNNKRKMERKNLT